MKGYLVCLFFLSVFILLGCTRRAVNEAIDAAGGAGVIESQEASVRELAKAQCIQLCREKMMAEEDLSQGPCLGNPLPNMRDWVCDVAHSPRTPIDNQPENQCSAFRQGIAKHFVEVDEECQFIRSF